MDSREFHNEDSYNTNTSSKNSSILCRQSSTRWIPTEEQVRILKDLYYNRGVRSPTAEQIQKISSLLGQYGRIEGKNVFYWFQNHKARERQKKKLSVETTHKVSNCNKKKYNSNISQGVLASPSAGFYSTRGETESSGYGAAYLKESSLGRSCFYEVGEVGFEFAAPTPSMMQYHFTKGDSTRAAESHEIDTLQLFPAHSNEQRNEEEQNSSSGIIYEGFNLKMDEPYGNYRALYCDSAGQQLEVEDGHHHFNGGHLASLELSLSSYSGGPSST